MKHICEMCGRTMKKPLFVKSISMDVTLLLVVTICNKYFLMYNHYFSPFTEYDWIYTCFRSKIHVTLQVVARIIRNTDQVNKANAVL